MTFEEKISDCIKTQQLIEGNDVIVGLSGGADSVCLAYTLKKLGFRVLAVHVQHGIRGEESLRDAAFAKKFCEENGIEFFIENIDVPRKAEEEKLSLETCARNERYRIFNEYSLRFSAPVAVAHNKNDQAETVLMHLIRGSGLNGLCGMKYKNKKIIRPLLDVSRGEIEAYLKENSVKFIFDSTNSDTDYTRNKVRREVLPVLESMNSGALNNIAACASLLSSYRDYFDFVCGNTFDSLLITKTGTSVKLKIDESVPPIMQSAVIAQAFSCLTGSKVDLERVHINAVSELIKKQSGKTVCLPFGVSVRREFDFLVFFIAENSEFYEILFVPEKRLPCGKFTVVSGFLKEREKIPGTEYIDFDKLPKNAVLRCRKSGDRISPLGLNGSMSLKKFFINKKIPKQERDTLPLLAKNSEVFAVFGVAVSDKVKICDDTKNILKLYKE